MSLQPVKYIWDTWEGKTSLEESAIKTVFKAKEILLKNIPNDHIVAIYIGGSMVRRELNAKSDVDTWTIVDNNRYIAQIDKLHDKFKDATKPPMSLAALSIWELKNNKRYGSSSKEKSNPSRFLKKLAFDQLIYGKPITASDYPMRSDAEDLRRRIEFTRGETIPNFLDGKTGFQEVLKQVLNLTYDEQLVLGYRGDPSWGSVDRAVKNKKHIIHEAYYYRNNPTKDKELRKRFIDNLNDHLNRLEVD